MVGCTILCSFKRSCVFVEWKTFSQINGILLISYNHLRNIHSINRLSPMYYNLKSTKLHILRFLSRLIHFYIELITRIRFVSEYVLNCVSDQSWLLPKIFKVFVLVENCGENWNMVKLSLASHIFCATYKVVIILRFSDPYCHIKTSCSIFDFSQNTRIKICISSEIDMRTRRCDLYLFIMDHLDGNLW